MNSHPKLDARAPLRVLLVDDHFFTRAGLTATLEQQSGLRIIAQAASGAEGVALYHAHQPDVAVLDGHLPDMHGTEVARQIRQTHPAARLLLFSVEETEEDIHRAVTAGASGYLPKSTPLAELIHALCMIAAGGTYFPRPVHEKLRERHARLTLSPRELEVLTGIAAGKPNKGIAADLNLSPETVKTYIAQILHKLGAEDRTQAVVTAMDRGLLKRK